MRYALAFLTGVLYAFGYPNFLGEGFAPLAPLAFLLLIGLLEKAQSTRSRSLATILHQIGFQVTGFYWVPHTLGEFGGLPPGVSHFVALFLSLVLNPAIWGYVLWVHYRDQVPGYRSWPTYLRAFTAAVLMTLFELAIPQQFPVYAGHVWMHYSQWLGLAPVGGVSLYSFFTWWLIFSLYPLLKGQRPAWSGLLATLVFVVANVPGALQIQLAVSALGPSSSVTVEMKQLNMRLVQANIGNFLKVASEAGNPMAVKGVIERYEELSLLESPQSLDLIVWPETAYPYSFSTGLLKKGEDTIPVAFQDLMARTGAELVIGGYDHEGSEDSSDRFETEYNSVFHFGIQGDLREVYHKHILIPFGETLPFGYLNRPLSEVLPAVSFFARGKEFPLFKARTGASFVTPICYEILQGNFIAEMLNSPAQSPDFLLNLTNDSWYGDTAEPFQHLFLAKWRALEFQRPIVRSTNTGITTVIYPDGREGRRLLIDANDVLDFRLVLPKVAQDTIYQRYGHWPMVGLWLVLGVILNGLWWQQNRRAADRASEARP